MGQDAAEYDFRDFRWAKLERLQQGASSTANMARDEALLEYKVSGETAAPSASSSPVLDAMNVNNSITRHSAPQSIPDRFDLPETQCINDIVMGGTAQPWWGLTDSESIDQSFMLDWSGLLGESGHPAYQTGDPTMFWSQL